MEWADLSKIEPVGKAAILALTPDRLGLCLVQKHTSVTHAQQFLGTSTPTSEDGELILEFDIEGRRKQELIRELRENRCS